MTAKVVPIRAIFGALCLVASVAGCGADATSTGSGAGIGEPADTNVATDTLVASDSSDTQDAIDGAADGIDPLDSASADDTADATGADSSELDVLSDGAAEDGATGGDTVVDTAPPAFALALTAPYIGQTFAPGEAVTAKVHVSGSATQIATSGLVWSLADSDGGNAAPVAGAPAIPGADGNASATLGALPVGVRSLTVKVDAGGADVATASAAIVVCPAKGTVLSVAGELPKEAMLAVGVPVVLKANVDDVVGPGAELEVVSDFDGVLGKVAIAPTAGVATTEVQLTITPQTKGEHQFSLRLVGGGAFCPAVAQVNVRVCGAEVIEDFAKDPSGGDWVKVGDATWDSGGWLELTGNAASKGGAFYNKALFIQPGDVRMTMRIATGGGSNGGADGFAMTIFEGKSPADVDAYLKLVGNGGCLGYGVSGACGSTKIEAFHVEIDTWLNTGDPNTDPPGLSGNNAIMGQGNHIAVHLDGDAGNALLWLPEPGKPAISVEDLKWHTVTIAVQGDKLTIRLDDTLTATKTVTGLDFRGGYVIFSGSTGWATNHHRIDDLRILHQCN